MATKAPLRRTAAKNHLEAMQHDLRCEIWSLLFERTMSPKELSEQLAADLPLVSHHTKRLVKLGCAELVETRPVRGAVEHFYRATRQMLVDTEDWSQLVREDPRLAEHIFGQNTQQLIDDLTRSVKAGTVGTDEQFLVDRTPVIVDAQGCDELIELFDRIELNEVVEIVQRSAERRQESGGDAVHMSVCLAIFKTPPR